jgi:hypothetical protein
MLVETTLNFLQNMFMFPTGTPAFLSCGALILDNTGRTDVGPVAAQGEPSFLVCRMVDQTLARRAKIDIVLDHVTEVRLKKNDPGFVV